MLGIRACVTRWFRSKGIVFEQARCSSEPDNAYTQFSIVHGVTCLLLAMLGARMGLVEHGYLMQCLVPMRKE